MRSAQINSLSVSVIGLGCNNFGRALDFEQSNEVVRAALDHGVTFFDTSDNYGNAQSEAFLGAALGDRRDEVVIATKFGMPVAGVEGSGGASPEYVARAADRSLGQLATDHIDLYQLHKPDPATPIGDTIGAMAQLVEAGKVREIGCSNLDAVALEEAIAAAESAGHPLFVSDQVEYSMLHRAPEVNGLSDLCVAKHVALLPFYPLACGMLTGKVERGKTPCGRLSMDRYQHYLSEGNFDIVEHLAGFCSERGLEMAHVAIAWLLAQAPVPAITPGATSREQIAANTAAAEWQPSGDDLLELDALLGPPA